MSASVYIAEDFPLTRQALRDVIERDKELYVVGETGDGLSAEIAILKLRPDLAILDYKLPGRDGLKIARVVLDRTTTKIVIFTGSDNADVALEAMQLGIRGYVNKAQGAKGVVKACRDILASDDLSFCSTTMDGIALSISINGERIPLSKVEQSILIDISKGLTIHRIGRKLNLAENTIKHHLKTIYEKLGVHTQAAAVGAALRHGQID
jgi:two-component system nitrate/nitrite response regulator NarL